MLSNFYSSINQRKTEARRLLSLPLCYGGLSIINPVSRASEEYKASQMIRKPVKDVTVEHKESFSGPQLQSIKTNLHQHDQQEIKKVYILQSKE